MAGKGENLSGEHDRAASCPNQEQSAASGRVLALATHAHNE